MEGLARSKLLGILQTNMLQNVSLGLWTTRSLNFRAWPTSSEKHCANKVRVKYAIPKINILHNLSCCETRFRLLCRWYLLHSSLNLAFRQCKLHNIFIFGMAYCLAAILVKSRWYTRSKFYHPWYINTNQAWPTRTLRQQSWEYRL